MAGIVLATRPGENGVVQLLVPAGSKDCMDHPFQRSSVGPPFLTPKCNSFRDGGKSPACSLDAFLTSTACLRIELGFSLGCGTGSS